MTGNVAIVDINFLPLMLVLVTKNANKNPMIVETVAVNVPSNILLKNAFK